MHARSKVHYGISLFQCGRNRTRIIEAGARELACSRGTARSPHERSQLMSPSEQRRPYMTAYEAGCTSNENGLLHAEKLLVRLPLANLSHATHDTVHVRVFDPTVNVRRSDIRLRCSLPSGQL
jgi:hypothetical protein